jgi:hypothetical protein
MVMLPILREQGIRFVRSMQNLHKAGTALRRAYTYAFNTSLRMLQVARTPYFGSISDFVALIEARGTPPPWKVVELMVHPTLSSDGVIMDIGSERRLYDLISALHSSCKIASLPNKMA